MARHGYGRSGGPGVGCEDFKMMNTMEFLKMLGLDAASKAPQTDKGLGRFQLDRFAREDEEMAGLLDQYFGKQTAAAPPPQQTEQVAYQPPPRPGVQQRGLSSPRPMQQGVARATFPNFGGR